MITHFKRIRVDFTEEQAKCRDGWGHNRGLGGRNSPCALPDECDFCKHWVCNACEEVIPWNNGGGETFDEGGAMLCDGCWCKFIMLWLEAEEALEENRMDQYKQACVL